MDKQHSRFHIGPRILKTAIAVVIAMVVVDAYGATPSKLIFAMLGAMAAVQPTFKESVEAYLSQIIGVLFGALAGIVLVSLPINHLVGTGIGIILTITLYNGLRIRYSPSLPCFIVVMLCTSPDIEPVSYALGRIWDTAIGLTIGMAINTLVFPYDNSRQIRATMESLDRELILFLEDMFDGDDILPDAKTMAQKIEGMSRQLNVFATQRFLLHLRRKHKELSRFQAYESKARQLVVHMEALCQMGLPGRLSPESRQLLADCGAGIKDPRPLQAPTEKDTVTNYHVHQILSLRQELLDVLKKK